jgi:hypothetical protein
MSELHFKFRERTADRDREAVLDRLAGLGARSVAPVFPGDRDRELAALYRVECGPGSTRRVIDDLEAEDAVEFVEPVLRRKLIR